MPYYYTDPSHQPVGPVSLEELTALRRTGQIGDDTPVIEEGNADWRACRDFIPAATPIWAPPALPAAVAPASSAPGLHRQRLTLASIAAVGIGASFLPWFYIPMTILGTYDQTGWISLALFVSALAVASWGARAEPLGRGERICLSIPSLVVIGFGATMIGDFYARKARVVHESPVGRMMAEAAQIGVGPCLVIVAGGALVAVAWAFHAPASTLPTVVPRFPRKVAAAVVALCILTGAGLAALTRLSWARQPESAAPSGAAASWHYVLYHGKRTEYRFVMPSYLHEAQVAAADNGADRSFVGPGGMTVSAYAVPDTARFWDDLKSSKRWRTMGTGESRTTQARSQGALTSQIFEVSADSIDGQQLMAVCVCTRSGLTYALTLSVPEAWPQRVRLEAAYVLGLAVGALEKMETEGGPSAAELAKEHPYAEIPLFAQLEAAGLLPGSSPAPTFGGGSASDQRLTRAQWKNKVSKNFGWLPGVPITAEVTRFQQVMGRPDDMQTLGNQTLWYYRCADGTVQLAMSALNLQVAGYMQAEVNDY